MLGFFPFTSINEILPSLMGVLGLLMTWEVHDLGVRSGRIQGLDISDPSVVRTWFRNHSRARMAIYTTPEKSSACEEEAKLAEVARMVADMGHDLNNLLTPIVLGASLVQGQLEECESTLPQLDPEQTRATLVQNKEILLMILTGARRIQDRVREISDSVQGLSTPTCYGQCGVADLVADVFNTLRLLANQQGVQLRSEQLDSLPLIMADESRLSNALYHLINNAIPAVPRGGSVTVRGQLEQHAKVVTLTVADEGRGMPPEVLESLFTGLGTKIAKDVVDAHGGLLRVESKQGVGTTFYLTLPIDGPVLLSPTQPASFTAV